MIKTTPFEMVFIIRDFMVPLIVVLCIIGAVMLLSKFLPDILRAIPALIGLIILAILIGGIMLVISLFI